MDISVDLGTKIESLLTTLATQAGITVEKVFPWFVRQQVIEKSCILFSIVSAVMIALILLKMSWEKANFFNEDETQNPWCGIFIASCFLTVLALIVFFVNMPEAISAIFNPEYAATTELLKLVK